VIFWNNSPKEIIIPKHKPTLNEIIKENSQYIDRIYAIYNTVKIGNVLYKKFEYCLKK
jgi:hypothetical protein